MSTIGNTRKRKAVKVCRVHLSFPSTPVELTRCGLVLAPKPADTSTSSLSHISILSRTMGKGIFVLKAATPLSQLAGLAQHLRFSLLPSGVSIRDANCYIPRALAINATGYWLSSTVQTHELGGSTSSSF